MTAKITVVGLGPGDPELLTRKAWNTLQQAKRVYLRTRQHPSLENLTEVVELTDFDHLYEEHEHFEDVYSAIVAALVAACQRGEEVVYAVPGDPTVGEATLNLLRRRAQEQGIELELIHGVSFVEPVLGLLEIDGLEDLAVADAHELAAAYHPPFPPHSHALVAQVHSRMVAADVKLTLMNQYPDDHQVVLLVAAGTGDFEQVRMPLHELDHREQFGNEATLYVPPLAEQAAFETFQQTVAHLRSPQGCPWDREQTHESLRQHLLEESYEALEAIDNGDMQALREELGDLLLQLVLQAQIATESGEFRMGDVIADINHKLVRRHPHVFGDSEIEDVDQVLTNWEHLKSAEREAEGESKGALDGVPQVLPALAQAAEYQSRAARLGFDWDDVGGVLDKIQEELVEVDEAQGHDQQAAEMGDLLFAVVNLSRWLEVDPEAALRGANQRFRRRFTAVERQALESGRALSDMNLEELDVLWEAAKEDEL